MVDTANEKTGPSATIDLEGLRRFLRDRKLGDAANLRTENISFGHSNEVHLIHFDGKSWALRRPPRGPLLPTAHDVMREFKVLSALQDTSVPLPRVYAACDDTGYIGAPFILMEYMRGRVIRSGLIPSAEKSFAETPRKWSKATLLMALPPWIGKLSVEVRCALWIHGGYENMSQGETSLPAGPM